jgi:oligoendopeptidase F
MNEITLPQYQSKEFGELPVWELSDLYSGPEGDDLEAAFEEVARQVGVFASSYDGIVEELDGELFGQAIVAYESISDLLGRIGSFAQLYQSQNIGDSDRGRFYQNTIDRMTTLSSRTLFFTLSINRLDDEALEIKLSDPVAAR